MDFEYVPKIYRPSNEDFFWFVKDPDKFYSFVEEFNIVGVHWSQPTTLSASYFLRLLEEGSSARARIHGDTWWKVDDEHCQEMTEYYTPLLDHGAMWKVANGSVICTAMPYGEKQSVVDAFYRMIEQYKYPDSITMQFLEDRYRYRPNGDHMIVIYSDASHEEYNPHCSYEELRRKATQHSAPGRLRYVSETSSFVRDRYVSEYAKRRADGACQLCGKPAPFLDNDGNPYLETHHVIWLADGGADSIENTVALCPNCHRKMHTLNRPEDIERLQSIASTLN